MKSCIAAEDGRVELSRQEMSSFVATDKRTLLFISVETRIFHFREV